MKRICFLGIFCCLLLVSCATTAAAKEEQNEVLNPAAITGPAFEDWRYKFFGQELPMWFLYAYESDFSGVIESREDLVGTEPQYLGIITGKALNGDQAEQFIQEQKQIAGEKVVDTFWAKLSEENETKESYRWLLLIRLGE